MNKPRETLLGKSMQQHLALFQILSCVPLHSRLSCVASAWRTRQITPASKHVHVIRPNPNPTTLFESRRRVILDYTASMPARYTMNCADILWKDAQAPGCGVLLNSRAHSYGQTHRIKSIPRFP